MKRLLIIFIGLWAVAYAQPTTIPGYQTVNNGWNILRIVGRAVNIPAGTTPNWTTSQWRGSGALFYDSTGTDTGLYVSHGAYWVKLATGTIAVTGAESGDSLINGKVRWLGVLKQEAKISGNRLYNVIFDSTNFIVKGVISTGQTIPAYSSPQMYFYPRKGAFRAGRAPTNTWNDASVGDYSAALNYGTTSSGEGSLSIGGGTVASGIYTFAGGNNAIASGLYAFAFGEVSTIASGEVSVAMISSTTTANYAASIGGGLKSKSYGGMVVGTNNDTANSASLTSYDVLNRAFQVGIGALNSSRANAMTILFSGNVGIGTVTPAKILHTVGTVRLASLGTATADTTTYKPLGRDSNGDVFPMTYWPGSGGGGNTIYTGDGSLSGNRTILLAGSTFNFEGPSGGSFLSIDPTAGGEAASLSSINQTGGLNVGTVLLTTTNTAANAKLESTFNAGAKTATVATFTDATTSTITLTSDSIYFATTLGGSTVGMVATLINPTSGSWHWAAGTTPTLQQVFATQSNSAVMTANTNEIKLNPSGSSGVAKTFTLGAVSFADDARIMINNDGTGNGAFDVWAQDSANNNQVFLRSDIANKRVYLHSARAAASANNLFVYSDSTVFQFTAGTADYRFKGITDLFYTDTTLNKPATLDAQGRLKRLSYWPSGGAGTVTNVATGLGLSGGPITTTGTIIADTTYLLNKSTQQVISGSKIFTVNQIFTAGELQIGSATDLGAFPLQVTGTQRIVGALDVYNASTATIMVQNTGFNASAGIQIQAASGKYYDWRYITARDNLELINAGSVTMLTVDYTTQNFGFGTSTTDATNRIQSQVNDAVTAAITYPLRLTHTSSGTATTAFGTGMQIESENASGTNRVVGSIDWPYTDAVNATEDADIVINLMAAGTIGERLRVTSDGRLYGTALHNNAGAVTGATNQYIASGTYTPTLTNVANLDASTAYSCQWMRVGNVVTVSGRVDIDPTLTATSTQLGISLPIASALANANELGGASASPTIVSQSAAVLGDATNDRAQLQYMSTDVTNQAMYFTFSYRII